MLMSLSKRAVGSWRGASSVARQTPQTSSRTMSTTPPSASPAANSKKDWTVDIEDAHSAAQTQGKDTYADPETGYSVFTKGSHERRGKCCGSLCRHCPFDYENVSQRIKDKRAAAAGDA